jgi:hypothetical protein
VSHTVYLRDRSSGRIHAGTSRGDLVQTIEACNLDDAGERDEITLAEAMEADGDALCGRCYPGGAVVDEGDE